MLHAFEEFDGLDRFEMSGNLASTPEPSAELRAIIERAVIPRLRQAMVGKVADKRQPIALGRSALGRAARVALDEHVAGVADRLLHDDVESVCNRIDKIRACGRPLERIYLDLLKPAAIRLGELLAADICGSAEVTIAFCNLQIVLRRYASDFKTEDEQPCNGLRALLASPPAAGDAASLQVFGLVFTSEFFRRAGWDAWTERSLTSAAFKDVVLSQWFDLVEVLATSDDDLDDIASGIKLIRRDSPNRRVGVVACGRVFKERPEFVRLVGADHFAPDPLSSLAQATQLVDGQTRRRRLS